MDSLKQYKADIAKYPKLTKAETEELFKRYWSGDETAYTKLVECNLYYVLWVYFVCMNGTKKNALDCIQAGNIALMKSVRTYNKDKASFGYFAFLSISRAIMREWYNLNNFVHITVRDYERLSRLKHNQLFTEMGSDPDAVAKVATALGMTEEEVLRDRQMLEELKIVPAHSVERQNPDSERESFYSDPTREVAIQEFSVKEQELWAKLEVGEMLALLTPREKVIIELYYGLKGGTPLTLREVSKAVNLTHQRVHQIINEATIKIRKEYLNE